MASQRIASVVLKKGGHSGCCSNSSVIVRHKQSGSLVGWNQYLWPSSSTAVIIFGSNQHSQTRWMSTQPSIKGSSQ